MRGPDNVEKIWGVVRDCDGAFGLDPSEQDLICCSVKPLRDLVDGFVHGATWLVRDRAIMIPLT